MFFNAIANALRPLFLKYQKSEFGVMLLPRFVPSLGKLGGARADRRVGEETGFFPAPAPFYPAGSPPPRLGLLWQRRFAS